MEYLELKQQIQDMLTEPYELSKDKNLLELGLSSLKIMRLVNQWRKQGIRVSFGSLMENPTLDAWWILIQSNQQKKSPDNKKISSTNQFMEINKPFSLTDVQYAYKIGREENEELGGIGCHAYFEFNGQGVLPEKLENAWNIVQNHHSMLRAKFLENGQQEIMAEPFDKKMIIRDLRKCHNLKFTLEQIRDELSHRKLCVEKGQVADLSLSLLPGNKTKIHFDIDLLVADVQSIQVILRDLETAYEGKDLPKESKKWRFSSYLHEIIKEERNEKEIAKSYWTSRLSKLPFGPDLPLEKQPSEISKTKFNRRIIHISQEEWINLQKKTSEAQATPAMLLLAAYAIILERWSVTKRFLINIPFFNRRTEYDGLENAVADFTTLLLLEVDMREQQTFYEVLESIQRQVHEDMKYTTYSGVQVQRDMKKYYGGVRNIAPIVFACNLGSPLINSDFENNLGSISYMISQTPGVWLDFQIYENNNGLILTWDTIDELFPKGMIEDMLQSLESLLHKLTKESWNQYFDVLPKYQKEFFIEQKTIESVKHPKRLFDDFLASTEKFPDKVAVIDTGKDLKITYRQLKREALSVANFLNSNGIKGEPVAITLAKGYDQVLAALGILMSGNEYVPISLKQPKERRELIHNKTGINYVVTDEKHNTHIDWPDTTMVWNIESMCQKEPLKVLPEISVDDPAYIIMTSGTTGLPKGAEIKHSGAWNTINDINNRWHVTKNDALLGVSSIDFDLSVYDMFGILGCGGTLVMIPEERRRDAEYWLEQILKYEITMWNTVPVLLDMLLIQAESQKMHLPIRLVLISGDWINIELPKRVAKLTSGCHFIAMGGATEASIWSNFIDVKVPLPKNWKSIPYGRPLSHQSYRIIDNKGMDVPFWVQGELWIGGAGVGTYRGDEDLTNKKFVSNDCGRWYRTGDNGRFWSDGTIEFLGRDDFQVKIRGHRIELGEIEVAIKRIASINNAVVEMHSTIPEDKYLIAFIEYKDKKSEPLFTRDTAILNQIESIWTNINTINIPNIEVSGFNNELNNVEIYTYKMMLETLFLLGVFQENQSYTFEEIISVGKIADTQKTTIAEWLSTLVSHEYLKECNGGFKISEKNIYPNKQLDLTEGVKNYFKKLKKHLLPLLQGQEKPINTFYVDNENLTPMDLFDELPGMREEVNIIISKIKEIIKYSDNKTFRILEFGTRDMKKTQAILEAIKDEHVEYYYADQSLFFVEKMNTLKKQYSFLRTKVLDIENNKLQLETNYDCILTLNVLHRLNDKETVLRNIKHLLNATGILLIMELTIETCLQDVTASVLEQKPKQEIILNHKKWNRLLQKNGFDKVRIFPSNKSLYGRNLFIAMSCSEGYTLNVDYIHSQIDDKLPEYMIPKVYNAMKQLPLSNNGKIDRKKLHTIYANQRPNFKKSVAVTDTESCLADIWKNIFQMKDIGIDDNYYLLGGDSLIATRMLTLIKKKFDVPFTIKDLMENDTISDQAKRIDDLSKINNAPLNNLLQIVPNIKDQYEPFELTEIQQAYWIGRSGIYDLGNVSTHCYFELDAEGIDINRLQNTWNDLIHRHGMMRAIIRSDGQQQILENVPKYLIKVEYLANKNESESKNKLIGIRESMSHQIIEADVWPLFEVRITSMPHEKYRIHISFDNLIFDGWSMFYLLNQWGKRYRGEIFEDDDLKLSFRDYVLALKQIKKGQTYQNDKFYWTKRINNFALAPELPLAKREEDIKKQRFNRRESYLTPVQWDSLKNSAKIYGITPSVLLITAYSEVLRRWSTNKEFSLNITQFDRRDVHPQINQLVGDFTTLTLLEIKNELGKNFIERAQMIQSQLIEDLEHTTYSAVELERELRKKVGSPKGSVMPVVFTSGLGIDQWNDDNWVGKFVYSVSQTPQVWLDHQVVEYNGGLKLFWDSVDEMFYPGMLDEMFNSYISLLQSLVENTQRFIENKTSLVKINLSINRVSANETQRDFSTETLDSMFIKSVKKFPNKTAIVSMDKTLTYKEVLKESFYIAQYLKRKGVRKGDLVAIAMEKGWGQIVSAYGILFVGAAYLPIDIHNPIDRIEKILNDSKIKMVLLQVDVLNKYKWLKKYEYLIVNGKALTDFELQKNNPEDLAYVIYTSGSTGMPKGVMITHKGVINTIQDVNERYQINERDKAIAISNMHFDLSVYDIFGILGTGGTVVIPASNKEKDPAHWIQLINDENITIWNSVPAFMEMLVEYEEHQKKIKSRSLKVVIMSGDWIPVTLPDRIRKIFGDLNIIAMGGATEASIWSNAFNIPKIVPNNWKSIPYGKPLANQKYYVLDENLNDCPDWVSGMLYISGTGLAKGYLNDIDKTNQKFINHIIKNERLYCTGDLGRYWDDGNIEFLGRLDDQVKIFGYRVELGEIKTSLLKIPGIRDALIFVDDSNYGTEMCALLVEDECYYQRNNQFYKESLMNTLPDYMIPSRYIKIEEIPLNSNGKKDTDRIQNLIENDKKSIIPIDRLENQLSDIHIKLLEIWKNVLKKETIKIDDNFFELGGNSLQAIQIINLIQKRLNYLADIGELFEYPTIREMEKHLILNDE